MGRNQMPILAIIARLGGTAYGASIIKEVNRDTGLRLDNSSLYTTLKRMASHGWIESWMGEPSPVRGGRRRRYYRITEKGREVIDWALKQHNTLVRAMALLCED